MRRAPLIRAVTWISLALATGATVAQYQPQPAQQPPVPQPTVPQQPPYPVAPAQPQYPQTQYPQQQYPQQPAQQPYGQQSQQGDPSQQQPPQPQLTDEQLDTLLAPIALYPDSLLSQVLMASTYPLEVVQAQRYVQANPNQPPQQLTDALAQQPWDPSVKSLVNFPSVLQMMSDKLDWTVQLGNAFLAQQQGVMNSTQRLRQQAQAAGSLQTNEYQKIQTVAPDQIPNEPPAQPYIVIDNVQPDYIYVPVYDPFITFGTWRYRERPWFWHPREYVPTRGIWWGDRCPPGPGWGWAWGRPDWRRREIDVDIHRHQNIDIHVNREQVIRNENITIINRNGRNVGTWQHDPKHRDGIAYGDVHTAERYGGRAPANDVRSREQYRGRDDQQRDDPKVNRQNVRDVKQDRDQPVNRQNVRDNPPRSEVKPQQDQAPKRDATPQRDTPQPRDVPRDDPKPQRDTTPPRAPDRRDVPKNDTPKPAPAPAAPKNVPAPAPAPEPAAPKAPPREERPANPRTTPPAGSGERGNGDTRADSARGRESRAAPAAPSGGGGGSSGGGGGGKGGAARH